MQLGPPLSLASPPLQFHIHEKQTRKNRRPSEIRSQETTAHGSTCLSSLRASGRTSEAARWSRTGITRRRRHVDRHSFINFAQTSVGLMQLFGSLLINVQGNKGTALELTASRIPAAAATRRTLLTSLTQTP
ncbi:hypothetical protein AAFF_G00141360 [Aldrovandia affinis]|uniref:Uncharacterized protein n=1 Tax=Aldrovandia affinis TaxID=143900 RepID=A0AAD7TCH5_9TELE|nr:hypothetical protein AAFF_G00141360 [Aldrovandia affinis]